MNSVALIALGAATVGVIHSILPDHWVPLAVVARTQRWSSFHLARISLLAAGGHVLASVVLGGAVALIGLQFEKQIETQQGHIVGGVLILTGLGFLIWGLTGHGHLHEHGGKPAESESQPPHAHGARDHQSVEAEVTRQQADDQAHDHAHEAGMAAAASHVHEHAHAGVRHSHRHSHEAFIRARAELLTERSQSDALLGRLTAIAVPFGVAASPDLTFLPFVIAACAYGLGSVATVLGVFSAVTLATFVGLTMIATAVGYQMRGEWLEKNANTVTSLVLIGVGIVAYVGF